MKKILPITLIAGAALIISAGAIIATKDNFLRIKATNERETQLVFNSSSVTVTDTSDLPYQGYFNLNATTESGYAYSSNNNSAGGVSSCVFKNTIDTKTYMFTCSGSYGGAAYFDVGLAFENIYAFESIVVDGIFTHSDNSITYRYTYTSTDTSVCDWYPDDGILFVELSSANMDNNYKSVSLEKITFNYSCAA